MGIEGAVCRVILLPVIAAVIINGSTLIPQRIRLSAKGQRSLTGCWYLLLSVSFMQSETPPVPGFQENEAPIRHPSEIHEFMYGQAGQISLI
jgi:hypothetical protein